MLGPESGLLEVFNFVRLLPKGCPAVESDVAWIMVNVPLCIEMCDAGHTTCDLPAGCISSHA